MTTEKTGPDGPGQRHADRVREAFESLHGRVGERLDPDAKGSMDRLREAAAKRDADAMREHLGQVRERHGWLYQELAAHPEISTLINELALWGF